MDYNTKYVYIVFKTEILNMFYEIEVFDSIPSTGQADTYVEDLLQYYNVECSKQDAVTYLKSVGAWSNEELTSHEKNLERLVWLACLDCQENETNFFYMGA